LYEINASKTRRKLMKRSFLIVMVMAGLVAAVAGDLPAAPYYEGKVIRMTVGTTPGGGFDAWARIVSRHLGNHIPGKPSIVVENIPGAGGLIQIKNLYSATKPDGLTIGHILGGFILGQYLGQPGYDFDGEKFNFIGTSYKDNVVLILSKKSGITSAEKLRVSPVPIKVGGLSRGNSSENALHMAKYIGFPLQIVSGYKGTTEIRLAMESGEVAGGPPGWDSAKTSWIRSDSDDAFVALQFVPKPLKELPKVPRLIDFAKTDEQKKVVEVGVHPVNEFARPFVCPPGVPKDRVAMLRKAFDEMVKDPEFLADTARMKVTVDPATGDELAAEVAAVAKADKATLAKIKTILFE
jgi:tripartite-type tricarboxylate transporter receptor subunit TctC